LLVTISGGAVSSVSQTAYELSAGASTSSGARFLVRGALASGVIARIQVPDVTKAASYAASVEQAAARTTYLQQSLVGYTMTVARPR
jgi:hypothetical protein